MESSFSKVYHEIKEYVFEIQSLRNTVYIVWSGENDLENAIKFVSRCWSGPSNIEWNIEIYRSVRFSWAPSSRHRRQRFWLNPGSEKKRKLGWKGARREKESFSRWSIRSMPENARDPAPFNVSPHLVRMRESIYDQTIHRNIPRFVDGRLSVSRNKEPLLHRERNTIFGHRNNRKKFLVIWPGVTRDQNEEARAFKLFQQINVVIPARFISVFTSINLCLSLRTKCILYFTLRHSKFRDLIALVSK